MTFWDRLMGRPTSTTYAAARARRGTGGPGDRGVVVFWRPGCTFCQRLALSIRGVSDRADWINIWEDDEARAFVRSVNGGDETVPTVLIDGEPHTNPSPSVVKRALAR